MKAKVLIIVLAAAVVVGCKHGANTDIILDENSINASDVDSGKDEGGDNGEGGIDSSGDGNEGDGNHSGNQPGGNSPNAGHASEPNNGGNNGGGGDKPNSGGNDNHNGADSSGGADTDPGDNDSEGGPGNDGNNGGGNNAHHPVLTTTTEAGEYLANHTGGASRAAIDLPMRIDLGDMTSPTSGWQALLDVLDNNGKYVNLDLSACAMNGTEFNYDKKISDGKSMIASIILPDMAESITDGSLGTAVFKNFGSLERVSGTRITTIGCFAFSSTPSLKAFDFPRMERIGSYAFQQCKALTAITLPASVTAIENNAFDACTNLNSVTFECSIPEDGFGTDAFSGNLRANYLSGGAGTYTTTAPVTSSSTWTKRL